MLSTLLGIAQFQAPQARNILLDSFDISDFEISAPQCPTHNSPAGSGDVLDIVVHQNVCHSEAIVSDSLDSATIYWIMLQL
jgi:hypothetical protein